MTEPKVAERLVAFAATFDLPRHLPRLSGVGRQVAPLGIVAFLVVLFIACELICRARETAGRSDATCEYAASIPTCNSGRRSE